MQGEPATEAAGEPQPVEERRESGGGLKIVLRKDREGEFSAGELPAPASADMDTDSRAAAQPADTKPPAAAAVSSAVCHGHSPKAVRGHTSQYLRSLDFISSMKVGSVQTRLVI